MLFGLRFPQQKPKRAARLDCALRVKRPVSTGPVSHGGFPMPDALHCRLMQICLASYSGTPPKFADVAWTDIAAGTKATPCGDKFDFAFVGEIPNPRPGVAAAVVIAFRGTLEPARPHDPDPILTIRDWVN